MDNGTETIVRNSKYIHSIVVYDDDVTRRVERKVAVERTAKHIPALGNRLAARIDWGGRIEFLHSQLDTRKPNDRARLDANPDLHHVLCLLGMSRGCDSIWFAVEHGGESVRANDKLVRPHGSVETDGSSHDLKRRRVLKEQSELGRLDIGGCSSFNNHVNLVGSSEWP